MRMFGDVIQQTACAPPFSGDFAWADETFKLIAKAAWKITLRSRQVRYACEATFDSNGRSDKAKGW